MKFSIAAAAFALGYTTLSYKQAFLLTTIKYSAAVSAAPTAPPAKFAIQITAKLEGKDVTRFLGKGGNGAAVESKDQALACSIESGNLVCGGQKYGATLTGFLDMAPIAPTADGPNAMLDGWSVGDDLSLHWKSSKFPKLVSYNNVKQNQKDEAAWGLFKSGLLTQGTVRLYAQLGCPGGTHGGFHDEVVVGTGKVVAL